MKNILNKYYLAFMAVILFGSVYSQTQISGSVMDSGSMEAIPGVNVIIDGTNIGTVTDFDGNFVINTSQDAPLTLIVSYVGYSAERVDVTSASQNINVMLSAGQNLEEIIVSASRRAQKVTDALVDRNFKMAVVDPRMSQTAAKADWWVPIKPSTDASFAWGMIRWIIENERFDKTALTNSNYAAAKKTKEKTLKVRLI